MHSAPYQVLPCHLSPHETEPATGQRRFEFAIIKCVISVVCVMNRNLLETGFVFTCS